MAEPRSIAIIGPYLSGKTTLLESILFATGAITRKGSVDEGNSIGDNSPEARARNMSTEVNIASTKFMGDRFTFLDCPGSVELTQETLNAIVGVDAAVVVCEADPDKAVAMSAIMKSLEDAGIPRLIFINKIDKAEGNASDLLAAFAPISKVPLVLRQIPIREGEITTGYVDLASERAYVYRPSQASEIIELPSGVSDLKDEARYQMLETLADFNDDLMEKVLEEIELDRDEVYQNLTDDFRSGQIVPMLLGAAELDEGVRRLLKFLRHEVPGPELAAARVGNPQGNVAQILKTFNTQRGGKLSVARVWSGEITDGMTLNGERLSGLFRMCGHEQEKISVAGVGEVVGLGRLEEAVTGTVLSDGKAASDVPKAVNLPPVYALSIAAVRRDDEVKMSTALAKVQVEDPGITVEMREDTHQLVMFGQGEIHLRITMDRLKNKYGIEVVSSRPAVPYKEAVRKGIQQHGRHKKQSGGHGQFGDVHIEIQPLPRGSGFEFVDKIVGGSVPRQYIPAVKAGVEDYLVRGPLGFPVVDLQVTLYDGQFHAVDSSEIAFKMAAQIAMREGMPDCRPVLLEPILHVDITVPNEFTSKINAMVASRRGQILGFEMREGWDGWDVTSAHIPQSEMHDFIIDLRSLTQGVGSFVSRFDHLQPLSGRHADDVVQARAKELAAA